MLSLLNNLPKHRSSKEPPSSLIDHAHCALLEEISNTNSWEDAERLCLGALSSCEIYSVRPASAGWAVELEYDNLLHEGEGDTPIAALSNALRGILETLELARAY